MLWRCWLGGKKGIRSVKNWVVGFWGGCLSGARCRLALWPSWCHCLSLSLASVKSRLVLPFWYRLTRLVPDKGPLNGCVCACVCCVVANSKKERSADENEAYQQVSDTRIDNHTYAKPITYYNNTAVTDWTFWTTRLHIHFVGIPWNDMPLHIYFKNAETNHVLRYWFCWLILVIIAFCV